MNVSPIQISKEFRIGYGPELRVLPQEPTDEWDLHFAGANRAVRDLWTECQIQAIHFKNRYASKIDIFYSGGIDSEFALQVFKQAQINVRVLTVNFSNGLNRHDLEYVEKFKKLNPQLTYENIDMDIEKFLISDEAMSLAEESKCTLPHLLLLMKIVKKSENPIILATGEPYIQKFDDSWFLRERESIASLYRFFKLNRTEGTHAFFQSSPEVFLSYLVDPVLKNLAQNKFQGKLSSLSSRHKLYNQYTTLEERPKYHGYEKIEPLVFDIQQKIERKFSQFMNIKYFPYNELQERIQFT